MNGSYSELKNLSYMVENDFLHTKKRNKLQINGKKDNIKRFTLALTEKCNAKCYYCYQCPNLVDSPINKDGICNFILNNSSNQNLITWFGGEPLIETKTIYEICEFLKNNNIDFCSRIITNGFLLKKLDVENFVKATNLKYIQITIDGLYEKHLTRKGVENESFSSLINNIKCLKKTEVQINLRINVSKENIGEVEEIFGYLDDELDLKNSANIKVYCASVTSQNNKSNYCFSKKEYHDIYSQFMDIEQKYSRQSSFNVSTKIFFCDAYNDNAFFIDKEGYLYRCEHDIWDKKKSIGTIYTKVKEKNFKKKNLRYLFKCRKCKYLPICRGGCLASSFLNKYNSPCDKKIYSINKRMDYLYNFIKNKKGAIGKEGK